MIGRRRKSAPWIALALLASGPLAAQDAAATAPSPPAAASPEVAAQPAAEAGPLVTAIEIRSDAPLAEEEDFPNLIEAEVGEPLTEERIRHTLRNLQASGAAAETELYTRDDPEGGGVVAIVVFRAVVQVSQLHITGKLGMSRDDLQRALPQGVAQPLSEDKVVQGVSALEALYQRNGYFRARVRVAVETDPIRRRAIVTYRCNSGPRATVSTIAFDHPVDPFQAAQLIKQLKLKPGDPFSRRLAGEDAERLQSWLIKQQYGQTRVDPPLEGIEDKGTVKLTYPISIGPKIVLVVKGADEKKLRSEGLLPFLGESGYDEALVLQAQNRLKTYFQQQGRYDVRVDTGEQRTDGQLVLTFNIVAGPIYTLKEIVFTGNQEIPGPKLREIMKTSPPVLLRRGSGRLVQADLDADLDNLRRFYALSGYAQAEVGPPKVEKTAAGPPARHPDQGRAARARGEDRFPGGHGARSEGGAQDPAAPGGEGVPSRPPRQCAGRPARQVRPAGIQPAPALRPPGLEPRSHPGGPHDRGARGAAAGRRPHPRAR